MYRRSLDSGDVQPPVFFRAIMYITSFGLCVDRHCRGGFGGLVALSGGCCFMLQEGWHHGMSPHSKVPALTVVIAHSHLRFPSTSCLAQRSVSLSSLALVRSSTFVLQVAWRTRYPRYLARVLFRYDSSTLQASPVLNSPKQILLLVLLASVMGAGLSLHFTHN